MSRIAAALGLGAVAGGVVTTVVFAASANLMPNMGPGVEARVDLSLGLLRGWLIVGLIATVGWAAGLLLIGGPAWILLHRMGLRARFHAMVIGALLAGGAGYVLGALAYAPFPTAWFVAFALIGMGVGWLIWSLCYGRKSRALQAAE